MAGCGGELFLQKPIDIADVVERLLPPPEEPPPGEDRRELSSGRELLSDRGSAAELGA
jgi:hypothetical protein